LIILVLPFFLPRPTATVTLTPVSKTLSDVYTVPVTARPLSSAQQGSQTGVPTGTPKPGAHATGTLTFKNYTSDGVTIPKGTTVTGLTGQQVATDKDVYVPPDPIIPGVASVSAHAVKVGKGGNIAAMSINKSCCFAGIYVLNGSAFSGGLDDQKDPVVLQRDIDGVAKALEARSHRKHWLIFNRSSSLASNLSMPLLQDALCRKSLRVLEWGRVSQTSPSPSRWHVRIQLTIHKRRFPWQRQC